MQLRCLKMRFSNSQIISVALWDWGLFFEFQTFRKNYLEPIQISKKNEFWINFGQNLPFLTFLILVVEVSNKDFCKLDQILRNFSYWQNCVFAIVFEICEFENRIFRQRSRIILEQHCMYFLFCVVGPSVAHDARTAVFTSTALEVSWLVGQ